MSSGPTSIQSQFNLNSDKSNPETVYEFENFRLNAALLLLFEDEKPLALAPKVVETLLALVERAGEIVSKKELMQRLWADSFVEDANLTQNVYLLRKTLGRGSDGRELIETFRRRGYRFTGEIRQLGRPAAPEAPPAAVAPAPAFDSLAVLPMANESDDETAEYLSDGITESVINRLSQLGGLRVVARNTAFRYKNREIEAREVGRELGVSAVLTGRVLQFGERLIIRTELVDAASGWQIWGAQYDRRASDALELQETIAREISAHLHLKLTGEERRRLAKRYTENSEAYRLFIKARYFLNQRLTPSIERAAGLFQQAIELDPTFVPAYVGLADCYPLLSLYGALTPHDAYPRAKAAAARALEIDDSYTRAYNSLGVVKLFYEWDWAGAEAAFRRAIELDPGYPDARQRYGLFLTSQGRFDEAVEQLDAAQRLDPLSPIIRVIGCYPFYYSRRYDEAARRLLEVVAADADYSMAHFRLGLVHLQQRRYEAAIDEIGKAVALSNDRDSIAALAFAEGLAGRADSARAALAELDEREKTGFVTSYNRVLVYLGLGARREALDWLERAYEERSYWLIYLRHDPALDALRGEARFAALEQKIFGKTGPETASDESASDEPASDEPAAPSASDEPAAALLRAAETTAAAGRPGRRRSFRLAAAALLAVLLLLLLAALAFTYLTADGPAPAPANVAIKRLTPDFSVVNPTISPDGKYLVYARREDGLSSLWLRETAGGPAKRIMPPTVEGYDCFQFSPDASLIYYCTSRRDAPNGIIVRIPVEGGTPQEIARNAMSPFSLSPDGRSVAFVRHDSVIVASVEGGGERILKRRDRDAAWFESWGSQLSWSPDGTRLAVCGGRTENGEERRELVEISVADASERRIPVPRWSYLDGVQWIPDGSGLMVIAQENPGAPFQIWRVAYPSGAATQITKDFQNYRSLSLSADSRLLVATQEIGNRNLWVTPLADTRQARQITFGTAANDGVWGLALMPDGRLVYTSPRSGNDDLWMSDPDGAHQRQLTAAARGNIRPAVSPDGRYIFFQSSRHHSPGRIWRIDADGGNARQLTDGDVLQERPVAAPDGKWVYFTWNDGRATTIWKVPVDGGAPARVSPLENVVLYSASPDGRLLAVQHYDEGRPNPWRVGVIDAATGELVRYYEPAMQGRIGWTPDAKALVYIEPGSGINLWQQPVEGGPSRPLTDFAAGQLRAFDISADGRTLVVSRGHVSQEAVLITNF